MFCKDNSKYPNEKSFGFPIQAYMFVEYLGTEIIIIIISSSLLTVTSFLRDVVSLAFFILDLINAQLTIVFKLQTLIHLARKRR